MEAYARSTSVERVSTRVIESIADERGVDPTELDAPLYWEVDLEALDRLCTDDETVAVTFDYDGTTVTVRGDGHIDVAGTVYEA
jgi:hypothetical protein